MKPGTFISSIASNPANAALLSLLPGLGLSQCYLTAGCLFQTVWNQMSGQPAGAGIKDYDIFYFDDGDLSWDGEDAVIRRVEAATSGLRINTQVRNQARVHLWYEQRFGVSCPRLASTRQAIDRFLIAGPCVGIEVASGGLYAPYGLEDLERRILRMNTANPQLGLFRRKAGDYRGRWPWLSIVDEHATIEGQSAMTEQRP
jgi:hypothetical protein